MVGKRVGGFGVKMKWIKSGRYLINCDHIVYIEARNNYSNIVFHLTNDHKVDQKYGVKENGLARLENLKKFLEED